MTTNPGIRHIPIVERVLTTNEQVAADNRLRFAAQRVQVINLMASPGAGKTTLLMATIQALAGRRMGVIEGDIASQVDAERIATTGAPVVQINTGGQCHLDASMIRQAMTQLPLDTLDLLFIENVGNLICPVAFDLGQTYKVGLLSVPEGHDKPYKYPAIFQEAHLIIVTKMDLQPYLDFDLAEFSKLVHALNPEVPILPLSAKTGAGMDAWLGWLNHLSCP